MEGLARRIKVELGSLRAKTGLSRPIRWTPFLTHVAVVALFGVLLPWLRGVQFMDPALPTIYACLGPFFAAPAAIQLIRQQEGLEVHALAKVLAASLYGEVVTLVILILGFATVLLGYRRAYLFLPDPIFLLEAILLGVGVTLALTSFGAWAAIQFSPGLAMTILRGVFVLLFAFFILRSWWLPTLAVSGAAISFSLAAIFLVVIRNK
jgi:hypothetical protein